MLPEAGRARAFIEMKRNWTDVRAVRSGCGQSGGSIAASLWISAATPAPPCRSASQH